MDELVAYSFALTVSESKRLIAKGVVALPAVQKARRDGMVIVTKGSTNAYVVEELTGEPVRKGAYVLGRTVPAKADTATVFEGNLPILVLNRGQRVEMSLEEAIAHSQRGDVVIKGANALNYRARMAGLLVGHPQGGTMGTVIGTVYGTGLHMVIPVGLEKEVAGDIRELAARVGQSPEVSRAAMPALWPIEGEIVTELEALALLTGCEAHQIGAGGLCGAEGASWFAVWGTKAQVAACKALIESLLGEPPFGA